MNKGRPKKYEKGTHDIHIRIEKDLYETITQMAKDEGCTRTDILRYLIFRGMK